LPATLVVYLVFRPFRSLALHGLSSARRLWTGAHALNHWLENGNLANVDAAGRCVVAVVETVVEGRMIVMMMMKMTRRRRRTMPEEEANEDEEAAGRSMSQLAGGPKP